MPTILRRKKEEKNKMEKSLKKKDQTNGTLGVKNAPTRLDVTGHFRYLNPDRKKSVI